MAKTQRRILVIDDDQDMCRILRRGLESESFAVDTSYEGEHGSYLARTNDYDLIVLDNSMPGKDGRMVCKDIRGAGKTVPILVLSAVLHAHEKVELLDFGADDYLGKPFSFGEFLARIRALMRRPRALMDETIIVGPLSMNTRTQVVRRGAREVNLTRKEYTMLKYLMANKGSVLSRSMLMEHVWDMRLDPFSNTVEAHMASLRKKLEDVQEGKLIHTISGRGYKIEA